jgi:hypothetical protein
MSFQREADRKEEANRFAKQLLNTSLRASQFSGGKKCASFWPKCNLNEKERQTGKKRRQLENMFLAFKLFIFCRRRRFWLSYQNNQ